MEEQNFRFCRKCLTRDIIDKDDYFRVLQEMINHIPKEVKASDEEYERRLSLCRDCEKLLDGMCKACGCYVELRAAKTESTCPYDIW